MSTKFITKDGYEKLKRELENLKTVERRRISSRIQSAKELGDLSENAEYAEAKDDQNANETKIAELEQTLHDLKVVQNNGNTSEVGVGSTIKAKTSVLRGGSPHSSGGDISCPSQVYLTGISFPSLKAALDSDNAISPPSAGMVAFGPQATIVDKITLNRLRNKPTCLPTLAWHEYLILKAITSLFSPLFKTADCPRFFVPIILLLDKQASF